MNGVCRRPLERSLAEHLLWLAKDRAVAVPQLAKLHTLSWKVHSALEEVQHPSLSKRRTCLQTRQESIL